MPYSSLIFFLSTHLLSSYPQRCPDAGQAIRRWPSLLSLPSRALSAAELPPLHRRASSLQLPSAASATFSPFSASSGSCAGGRAGRRPGTAGGWRADLARKQNEQRGLGSELGSEYLVLERLLDPSFATILLFLTRQLNLKRLLEILLTGGRSSPPIFC